MGGVEPGERRERSGGIIENNKRKTQSKYFIIYKTSIDIGILKPSRWNITIQQTMKIFISNSHSVKTDHFRLYIVFPTFRPMWRGRKEDKREDTSKTERSDPN